MVKNSVWLLKKAGSDCIGVTVLVDRVVSGYTKGIYIARGGAGRTGRTREQTVVLLLVAGRQLRGARYCIRDFFLGDRLLPHPKAVVVVVVIFVLVFVLE